MELFERIAEVCHEANRAYCKAIGDDSQLPWSEAPDWQKASAVAGVRFKSEFPLSTPADSHNSWLVQKQNDGWIYGPEKNVELKQHPCMLEYSDLPDFQRAKDHIFQAISETLLRQSEYWITHVDIKKDFNCDPGALTGLVQHDGQG